MTLNNNNFEFAESSRSCIRTQYGVRDHTSTLENPRISSGKRRMQMEVEMEAATKQTPLCPRDLGGNKRLDRDWCGISCAKSATARGPHVLAVVQQEERY